MGKVRPFVEEDIPEVVRLRQKSFRYSDRPTSDQLAQYFCDMFLKPPWRDEELPSLVYDDATGRPVGFVGVFPRGCWRSESRFDVLSLRSSWWTASIEGSLR
jgi:hypothetical protein